MKPRKTPIRMCIGCRKMKPKKELTRIVRTMDGQIVVDPTGKKSGRGAYICQDSRCMELSLKEERLSKALNSHITKETVLSLKEELKNL